MFRPAYDVQREAEIRHRLEAFESAALDQIDAELAELESGLIVAKARSGNPGEHDVRKTRRVAVAMLEAETDHFAYRQGRQIGVKKPRWPHELAEHIGGREGRWVRHQWQIDERLDSPAGKP